MPKESPPPIMGVTEVATYAGVSRQLAAKWARTWNDWPAPFAVLSAGTFWATDSVLDVLRAHERKPGQGPREAGDPRSPSALRRASRRKVAAKA